MPKTRVEDKSHQLENVAVKTRKDFISFLAGEQTSSGADKTNSEYVTEYKAIMVTDFPGSREGRALYEILIDPKAPQHVKNDFYDNAPEEHREALAGYLYSEAAYGRGKELPIQDSERFYMKSKSESVLLQGMRSSNLTIDQKRALAEKYSLGFLDLDNITKIRPVSQEMYGASLKHIQDSSDDPKVRRSYYDMLAKDFESPEGLKTIFKAFQIQDNTKYFYSVHESMIANENTSDEIRLAAINESIAFEPTDSISAIRSLPKKYQNICLTDKPASDPTVLTSEQRAAFEKAREKLHSSVAYWDMSEDCDAPRLVRWHTKTIAALDTILQENFAAGFKNAQKDETSALRILEEWKGADADALTEIDTAATKASDTVKLYTEIISTLSLERLLTERIKEEQEL